MHIDSVGLFFCLNTLTRSNFRSDRTMIGHVKDVRVQRKSRYWTISDFAVRCDLIMKECLFVRFN